MRSERLIAIAALMLLGVAVVACKAPGAGSPAPAVAPAPSPKAAAPSPREPQPPETAPPKPENPHPEHRSTVGIDRSPAGVAPPAPAPPTDDQLIDSALRKLRKGNLAYSTPDKMKSGETAHVVARIAGDTVSIDTLKSNLPTDPGAKIAVAATPVSTKMKMTLKGADFDITPLSSEEQIVAGDTPTQWEWDIIPKHSGTLRLHLAAVVEINDIAKDFTTVDRDIPVQVDPVDEVTGFISRNWQWLIATLTAVVGAGWKYFNGRKEKTSGAATT